MDRRSFIALSAVVLAGCGQQPSTDTSTPTATGTATDTPTATTTATDTPTETATATDTPTETATDTPTETATPELSDREEQAAEALSLAIRDLNEAVYTYAGSENGSLLDVSAASESFSSIQVLGDISDADDYIEDARATASGRQQSRLAAVEDARQFLRICLQVQERVIAAYGETERARDAVDSEQAGTIEDATGDLRNERERGRRSFANIESETSAETVSVLPSIPAEEYEAKVAQFDAELDGFGSLADFFDRLHDAVDDLNDAERFDRVERERTARERAQQAAEAFEALTTELDEFASNLTEDAAAIEGIATDLVDIAETKAEKAREIEEDNA